MAGNLLKKPEGFTFRLQIRYGMEFIYNGAA